MHAVKDRAYYMFKRLYGSCPLMANISLTIHHYFQEEGYLPVFAQQKRHTKAAFSRIEYTQNDTSYIKSHLYKSNGLVIYMPHQLVLQVKPDELIDNQVGLCLKELSSNEKAIGAISELNVQGYNIKGAFNEQNLQDLLSTCLSGPYRNIL